MDIKQRIKVLCIKTNTTQAVIAKSLNMSSSNFSNRLKNNKLTLNELEQIAKITNCTYNNYFTLSNGEKI